MLTFIDKIILCCRVVLKKKRLENVNSVFFRHRRGLDPRWRICRGGYVIVYCFMFFINNFGCSIIKNRMKVRVLREKL